jgi:SAM-dependent methyltransferase
MSGSRAQLGADDNAGWLLLLPPPGDAAPVLCLELGDTRFAEGTAFWHGDVTALNLAAQSEVKFRSGSLLTEQPLSRPWQPGDALPYDNSTFAVLVCRLAGQASARIMLPRLLSEMTRVLRADGCLYVDVDNPGSYQSSDGVDRRGGLRRGALRRLLFSAGFAHQAHHPQIFEQKRLNELIPAQGYRPSRNAWRRRERLKQWLLGRNSSRWFAPVHGVVASRSPLAAPAYATLPAFAGVRRQFRQFLVNPGKCFVAGDAAAVDIPLITVVPTRTDTISRRRVELAALARLRAAALPVARLLPRVAREVPWGRGVVFEYEAIPGTTLDLPEPHFEQSLQRAFWTLRDFNRSSLRQRVLTPQELDALVAQPAATAAVRYPRAAQAAARLAEELRRALRATPVPVVWQHGDYKLENLVFDNERREVRAIIDWELSAPAGLALVDLLYLLTYAEITRGAHADVLQVMQVCLLPERWPPGSRALLQAYVQAFPEVTPFKDVCSGLFLLHHVANRFTYDARDLDSHQSMTDLMLHIAARLEGAQARP